MTKVAIIGANESICFLINEANRRGYETVVFSQNKNDPGASIAKKYYNISITEREKILDVCLREKIDAVVSITSDLAVTTVNFVARNLGLVGNSEHCDLASRDKYVMRCCFRDCGLNVPDIFMEISDTSQLSDINERMFPLIVKPVDSWNSCGVSYISSKSDISSAVSDAINKSLSHRAIVETYITGPEYSAECIVYDGQCTILAITEKITSGRPHFIEIGHNQPAPLSKDILSVVDATVKKGVKSLGIENSAAHVEFKICGDRVYIVEIGARMGGGCIGTDLTPLSTLIDYVGAVLDVSLGIPPKIPCTVNKRKVSIRFIISEEDYLNFLQFMETNASKIVRYSISDLNFDKAVVDGAGRHGYYIFYQD